jgi:succinate dehydrogenase/fumarate reductase flavoprotein subunit
VDLWWRSNINGLFPVGEAAGTHGVYRPGGSALNAGQVGSLRAARYIAHQRKDAPDFRGNLEKILAQAIPPVTALSSCSPGQGNVRQILDDARKRMTSAGGAFRSSAAITSALGETGDLLGHFAEKVRAGSPDDLPLVFRLRDTLICQYVYLFAMDDYLRHSGKSRGSALYQHKEGLLPHPALTEEFRYLADPGDNDAMIQEIRYVDGVCGSVWRPVQPIPKGDNFFENVWRGYRENMNLM